MTSFMLSDANAAARLAGLLDAAMDAIITVDEAQRIVLYNHAAERIFGFTALQVMGRPLDMLIPKRFRGSHREEVRRFGATGLTNRRMGDRGVLRGCARMGRSSRSTPRSPRWIRRRASCSP